MAVRKKGAYRVVLTLDLNKQSSAIEVDVEDVGSFDVFPLTLKMDTDRVDRTVAAGKVVLSGVGFDPELSQVTVQAEIGNPDA